MSVTVQMSMERRAGTAVLISAMLLAGCAAEVLPEPKVVVDGVPAGSPQWLIDQGPGAGMPVD